MTSEASKELPPEQNESNTVKSSADEQILAHRQQHQQKIKKLFGGVLVLIIVVAGGFYGYQYFKQTSEASPTTKVQSTAPNYTDSQLAEFRERFKQALTQYEANIQPVINQIKLSDYDMSKVAELSLLKEQALNAFAQGAFGAAKTNIEKLVEDAQLLIQSWESETQQLVLAAKTAFDKEDIPHAQLNINKALALMPLNPEALALQARIDAHAEIATLLNDLQVAKIENNLSKQINLLSDIIQLDPQRNTLNQDLAVAQKSYNQQQLVTLLERTEQAIETGKIANAETFLEQAKAIKPASKGVVSLTQRIAKLKTEQSLTQVKAKLAELQQQDNWTQVASLSAKYLLKHSSDNELFDFQQNAQRVVDAKKSLNVFVSRPNRLADTNIREAASAAIQKAFAPSLQSPSLQQTIAELGEYIDSYSSPVDVTIKSDENTYIMVIGVGHVGQQALKTIQLTPGDYILQGTREGFRTKRLELSVKANTPVTLTLICDQAI